MKFQIGIMSRILYFVNNCIYYGRKYIPTCNFGIFVYTIENTQPICFPYLQSQVKECTTNDCWEKITG